MAEYLPQIEHASERQWAFRREILDPARTREASLLREAQVVMVQERTPPGRRWFSWLRGIDARMVSRSRVGSARASDGIA